MIPHQGNGILLLIVYLDSLQSSKAIAMKVEEMRKYGKQLFSCMIIDEISVKQHTN